MGPGAAGRGPLWVVWLLLLLALLWLEPGGGGMVHPSIHPFIHPSINRVKRAVNESNQYTPLHHSYTNHTRINTASHPLLLLLNTCINQPYTCRCCCCCWRARGIHQPHTNVSYTNHTR